MKVHYFLLVKILSARRNEMEGNSKQTLISFWSQVNLKEKRMFNLNMTPNPIPSPTPNPEQVCNYKFRVDDLVLDYL